MKMTSSYNTIVQIMLFTKHHYLLCILLLNLANACNIWKASDCPQPPTADDEEIVGEIFLFLCPSFCSVV
jgi:hypothetical protein